MSVSWIASPPVALGLFGLLAALIYWVGGRWGARGAESRGKREPYACGEDLDATEHQLSYQRFFRLGLAFVVVHLATLVIAMLPRELDSRLVATAYLIGVAICVEVLVRDDR
jgi:NADH:ubiquinone oxidoreductase subunit 3 (subunit A)